MKHGELRKQELQQILQEEKVVYGITPDKAFQELVAKTVEESRLSLARDVMLPLMEIAVAKWKNLEPIQKSLFSNIKKWQQVVESQQNN